MRRGKERDEHQALQAWYNSISGLYSPGARVASAQWCIGDALTTIFQWLLAYGLYFLVGRVAKLI